MSSTAYIYPTGTAAAAWTPSSGGGDHHLLLDDVYPPGDTSDYIRAGGVAVGTEKLSLGAGPAAMERVTKLTLYPFHYSSEDFSVTSGIRLDLVVNSVVVGTQTFVAGSGGVIRAVSVVFGGLNIPAYVWQNSTRELWLTPLDLTGVPWTPMEDL